MPKFRLRTLMIAVAVFAVLLITVPPWWEYWFNYPWRVLIVDIPILRTEHPDGTYDKLHGVDYFNLTHPEDAQRFLAHVRAYRDKGYKFSVEKYKAFPKRRFKELRKYPEVSAFPNIP